jgi:hypothetical protein
VARLPTTRGATIAPSTRRLGRRRHGLLSRPNPRQPTARSAEGASRRGLPWLHDRPGTKDHRGLAELAVGVAAGRLLPHRSAGSRRFYRRCRQASPVSGDRAVRPDLRVPCRLASRKFRFSAFLGDEVHNDGRLIETLGREGRSISACRLTTLVDPRRHLVRPCRPERHCPPGNSMCGMRTIRPRSPAIVAAEPR